MSERSHYPTCANCCRDAGEDATGATWQCHRHAIEARDAAIALLHEQQQLNIEIEERHQNALALLTKREAERDLARQEAAAAQAGQIPLIQERGTHYTVTAWETRALAAEAALTRLQQERDGLEAERNEAVQGLRDCHMLARRALTAATRDGMAKHLPHIIRICERQAPKGTEMTSILREPRKEPTR